MTDIPEILTERAIDTATRGAFPEFDDLSERQRDLCRAKIRKALAALRMDGFRLRHVPLSVVTGGKDGGAA